MKSSPYLPLTLTLFLAGSLSHSPAEDISFNREIKPLLSDKCSLCHGPDQGTRKADLRLDQRESAVAKKAIVPGKPEESEVVRRIFSSRADVQMPPPEAHKTLSPQERELIRSWIAQGAKYEKHWAYIPPVRPPVSGVKNPLDELIDRRLKLARLQPAPEADPRTLVRRLYADLVGLPPPFEEVEKLAANPSPPAYSNLVERLLAMPQYGERMAQSWLDVVRFADTIGYHSDNPRNIWPYRDYVIESFNSNKPFDQFTREQLAGDLLPDQKTEYLVGSAFNRLLLTTEEGGAQPKDYEYRMLTDRVRSVGTVWLGQTLGCAACHDHKFDPVTMQDFYSLGAFFADLQEPIIGKREEGLLLASEPQKARLAELETAVGQAQKQLDQLAADLGEDHYIKWEAAHGGKEAGVPRDKRKPQQVARLRERYFETAPEFSGLRKKLETAKTELKEFDSSLARCLVSISTTNYRPVHILPRGNFLQEKDGPTVEPGLPVYLAGTNSGNVRLTRLDLANWLVAQENPLTARVVMNRLWKHFFGLGLSRVLDDLGAQGEPPQNPELLDWLACEFMDSGWDWKHMVRLITTSQAYRRSSVSSDQLRQSDPYNRQLAVQGRWRLEAESVRDYALFFSGLLDSRIGGPSVKPYQPEGYWENLNFPVRTYSHSSGSDQYRRGLYVWWQRSYLHPSLLAFDAPTREECTADRNRSNLPQQALVLLNDPTYVEASRAFATRILREGGSTTAHRIQWAWRTALARNPQTAEVTSATEFLEKELSNYTSQPEAALHLLQVGQQKPDSELNPSELAAWTNLARVILNLHETLTRS